MPRADLFTGEDKITAVIVTYNPDLAILAKLIGKLKFQVHTIIVVDNHSSCQNQIQQLCSGIKCCLLPSNLGLGKAHNLGIEYAEAQGSKYVLVLDQDSSPDSDMVGQMLNTAESLQSRGLSYSAIGSRYRDKNNHLSDFVKISWFRFSRLCCDSNSSIKTDFLISSGSLIPLSAIKVVGLMDESLFIDHIDTEWFMRASGLGYDAYGCCKAFMSHSLGERTTNIWLGRWRNVPYHRSFRYYYIFRNSILLYRRGYMPFKWMLADWIRLGQTFLFFGCFAKNRMANQKMLWKGILDGIKGTSGRNDFVMTQ